MKGPQEAGLDEAMPGGTRWRTVSRRGIRTMERAPGISMGADNQETSPADSSSLSTLAPGLANLQSCAESTTTTTSDLCLS